MTLMLSSKWQNFRPYPSIDLNSAFSHIQQNPPKIFLTVYLGGQDRKCSPNLVNMCKVHVHVFLALPVVEYAALKIRNFFPSSLYQEQQWMTFYCWVIRIWHRECGSGSKRNCFEPNETFGLYPDPEPLWKKNIHLKQT